MPRIISLFSYVGIALDYLQDEERGRVADAMGTVKFSPKQCIIEQGGQGDRFYIVVKGHVHVKKKITEKVSIRNLH